MIRAARLAGKWPWPCQKGTPPRDTHRALALTGIAGPGGGSAEKPVGLVWIALAGPDDGEARRFIFPGDRLQVRQCAALMALALLRWKILGVDPETAMHPAPSPPP